MLRERCRWVAMTCTLTWATMEIIRRICLMLNPVESIRFQRTRCACQLCLRRVMINQNWGGCNCETYNFKKGKCRGKSGWSKILQRLMGMQQLWIRMAKSNLIRSWCWRGHVCRSLTSRTLKRLPILNKVAWLACAVTQVCTLLPLRQQTHPIKWKSQIFSNFLIGIRRIAYCNLCKISIIKMLA